MNEKMKVLHLASFNGNIGDNANHNGFYHLFKKHITENVEFDQLEMRKFYFSWDDRKFDESFVKEVNQYDLLVIGGGNFFDITWPDSATGTTIDISYEVLQKINTPILFNALGLGYGVGRSYNKNAVIKFKDFLDYILAPERQDQYFLALRNDGAYNNLQNLYGNKYSDKVIEVPDNGFFHKIKKYNHSELIGGYKSIGVNLVFDSSNKRFSSGLSYDDFIFEFSEVINSFLKNKKDYQIIFFPHIYSDLKTINKVIENIDKKIVRKRIKVAPYLHGQDSEKYIFNLYNKCELILGMRFHSNVGAIANNIPSIGMATNNYRVSKLYDKLSIKNRCLQVDQYGFSNDLKELIEKSLSSNIEIVSQYKKINNRINNKAIDYFESLNNWIPKRKE
ncbi:MAG: polysaccharide pyruvyl transferase family protein [Bacillota bacterium]